MLFVSWAKEALPLVLFTLLTRKIIMANSLQVPPGYRLLEKHEPRTENCLFHYDGDPVPAWIGVSTSNELDSFSQRNGVSYIVPVKTHDERLASICFAPGRNMRVAEDGSGYWDYIMRRSDEGWYREITFTQAPVASETTNPTNTPSKAF